MSVLRPKPTEYCREVGEGSGGGGRYDTQIQSCEKKPCVPPTDSLTYREWRGEAVMAVVVRLRKIMWG